MRFFLRSLRFLSLLAYIFICLSYGEQNYAKDVKETLLHRLHHLSTLANSFLPQVTSCNDSAFIIITEIPYGQSSNNEIEFINGLWLSQVYHYTLVVPWWMAPSLHPFNLTRLHSHFCFTITEPSSKKVVLEVTSEDSFLTWKLFRDRMYNSTLPAFNEHVYLDISRHYLLVFSALWSSPSHHILNATNWLISEKLHGFNYTSVHKRSFEGGCTKLMNRYQSYANDYDAKQVDLTHPAWWGDIKRYHPICEMPASFAIGTMKLNQRAGQKIYVAYDGRGSIADYDAINATSLAALNGNANEQLSNHLKKYVDMLVAMNGDFFIMNPYSTFSFQVFVMRVALQLQSVPTMHHRDLYFNQVSDTPFKHLWVSADSIIAAYESLKNESSRWKSD
jgi:hypothetical protein